MVDDLGGCRERVSCDFFYDYACNVPVNEDVSDVCSYSSIFSMFFSPNVRTALQYSNLPFVFKKIPFNSKIEQFPSGVGSQHDQRNLAFNIGNSRKIMSDRNVCFFQ